MQLSDAEWKVMHCLWRRQPVTAREVLEQLEAGTGWSYSTVRTLLARLVEKGAAAVTTDGAAHRYAPTLSRSRARSSAVRGLLERAFDGALGPLFQHLAGDETLHPYDRQRLRALLEELDDGETGDDDTAAVDAPRAPSAPGADAAPPDPEGVP